ncbi:MAG: radical SAM protein [Bacteroidales bacterium]|nr:radical SAM protein [Bacteroidales bacterium]
MQNKAPFIGISRHRIDRDGEGVTTLAAFHGCPLRCKYCLNPQCLREDGIREYLTPQELLDKVVIDDLYFQATGGGITFGGGEPAKHSRFIEEFRSISNPVWKINIETSLNVPQEHIERIAPFIHQFIIDIKDMNNDIYKSYTGITNTQVRANLEYLSQAGLHTRCLIRIPRIPNFNTQDDIEYSKRILMQMGYTDFDEFEYQV